MGKVVQCTMHLYIDTCASSGKKGFAHRSMSARSLYTRDSVCIRQRTALEHCFLLCSAALTFKNVYVRVCVALKQILEKRKDLFLSTSSLK